MKDHVTGVYLIGLDTNAFHPQHVPMMPIVPELLPDARAHLVRHPRAPNYLDIEKKLSSAG